MMNIFYKLKILSSVRYFVMSRMTSKLSSAAHDKDVVTDGIATNTCTIPANHRLQQMRIGGLFGFSPHLSLSTQFALCVVHYVTG